MKFSNLIKRTNTRLSDTLFIHLNLKITKIQVEKWKIAGRLA